MMIVNTHGVAEEVVEVEVVELVITFPGEVVLVKGAKTAKVLKWLTETVIVWLTVSILTVVNCSHFPVDGLYQAPYGVEPAGTRLGS